MDKNLTAPISIRFEQDFRDELEAISKKRHLPLATLIRLIVADHYKEYDTDK